MSIWGKLASATAELRGSPIGAVLGSADAKEPGEIAFAVGVIALGAKMAKADAVVTGDEVNAFKTVFKVPEGEVKNVARVFNLAKQDATGYEAYAEQLAVMFKGNRKLLEYVLEGLFHIAKADRVLHPNEERLLTQIAKRFGITRPTSGASRRATRLRRSVTLTTCWG
jgi:DnaJ like chaperone protein